MIGAVVDKVIRGMEKAAHMNVNAAADYLDADTVFLMCGKCQTKKHKKIATVRSGMRILQA